MDFFGPHLLAYFIATLHFLGTLAAIHAVLTVRTAQGSIAWALSLMFVPYLTLIPYLIFGRSTFDAYIQARRQANQEMHTAINELNWRPWVEEALAARNSSAYASLRAMPKLGRMPCLANNEVRLLINGDATFSAIFDAIRRAKTAVLFQFFIIHDDELGRQLHALLKEKVAQGVAVYVLYDRIGSHALPSRYVQSLRDAGVQVKAFATRSGWLNRFQVNFRNHRKIVVVDGITGFVGGHNVGDEYLGKKPPLAPWRDTHVQVIGPVVACLQESFAEDWFWAARELPPLILPDTYPEDGVLCQLLASGPADPYETCSLFFVEAIHAATERVWITSPYFIPDEAVFAALSLYAIEAVRAGVRVFRYRPGFLHQKVVLVDSEISAIGSANMDNRSFRLNFEVMLLTVDEAFAQQVEHMLLDDFAQAHEVSQEESRETRRLQQLGMRIARLISPIL